LISLISQTEDPLKVVATAARICYSSLPLEKLLSSGSPSSDRALVKKVLEMGHLSVAEHATITLSVDGSFKEELFSILRDKPFLKVTEHSRGFIVSLNFRTAMELISEKPELEFTKALSEFLPKLF